MKRYSFLRTGAYALLCLGTLAGLAMAYSYAWTGGSSGSWSGENWDRLGCEDPCFEYPDDTGDDALIATSTQISNPAETIDDLTITDADVRLGPTSTGQCSSYGLLIVDSVIVAASAGHTAQLRGGHCYSLDTN